MARKYNVNIPTAVKKKKKTVTIQLYTTVCVCSFVPRPLPVFLCVTLKNWEWPGNKAMCERGMGVGETVILYMMTYYHLVILLDPGYYS